MLNELNTEQITKPKCLELHEELGLIMLKTQGTEMFKSIVSSHLTHLLFSLITKSAFNADRQRDRQTE